MNYQHHSIGELGKATATKVETIRYYERIGLLAVPDRTAGNYRSYSSDDLARLSFIRRARNLGFSIDQVRALLGLSGEQDGECGAVDVIARKHLKEVERKIADLEALQTELRDLIRRCKRGKIADCRIIAALSPA